MISRHLFLIVLTLVGVICGFAAMYFGAPFILVLTAVYVPFLAAMIWRMVQNRKQE